MVESLEGEYFCQARLGLVAHLALVTRSLGQANPTRGITLCEGLGPGRLHATARSSQHVRLPRKPFPGFSVLPRPGREPSCTMSSRTEGRPLTNLYFGFEDARWEQSQGRRPMLLPPRRRFLAGVSWVSDSGAFRRFLAGAFLRRHDLCVGHAGRGGTGGSTPPCEP